MNECSYNYTTVGFVLFTAARARVETAKAVMQMPCGAIGYVDAGSAVKWQLPAVSGCSVADLALHKLPASHGHVTR